MRLFTPLLIICLALFCSCQPSSTTKENSQQELSPMLKQLDSIAQLSVLDSTTVGLSWGILQADQAPFFKSYGLTNISNDQPFTNQIKTGIASITKPFTATLIGLLAEEGTIQLDQTIDNFFPDFPKGDQTTVYQLLSHTAGVPDWWMGGLPETDVPENWTSEANRHKTLQRMNQVYIFEPGTQFFYSNSGFALLADIIEQVSGKPYGDVLHERIIKPLKLTNTVLGDPMTDPQNATGYGIQQNDSISSTIFEERSSISTSLNAFGGIRTTASDLLTFTSALVKGQLVSSTFFQQMSSYAQVNSGVPVYEARYWPAEWGEFSSPPYMEKSGYGLGLNLTEMYGQPVVWHSGGMPGYNAIWCYLPEKEIHFALLANTDNGAVPAFEEFIKILTQ
ncbi:MAG: serine hydrolase domain-containing protein [Bacteroidota bacterium]